MVWRRRQIPIQDNPVNTETTLTVNTTESEQIKQENLPPPPSNEYIELQKLLNRCIFKDSHSNNSNALFALINQTTSPKNNSNTIDASILLQEGRQILKQIDVGVKSSERALWIKSQSKMRLILLSDILLVCSYASGNMYAVEHVIDLKTCKIRAVGQSFGAHANRSSEENQDPHNQEHENNNQLTDNEEQLSFDLLWPGGELRCITSSREMREVLVLNIYFAICENVDVNFRVLGWRHHFMLGTMHSAVLSRDEDRVRELIQKCELGKL